MLFHTTGEQFWTGKSFSVSKNVGDSEFKGLFGASGVSPTFARITGSSSSTKLFPSLKDLISVNKPGTAGVIPTRFVKGVSGKPGEAFVPGAVGFPKTEIQAILSTGSKANLISNKFYYQIQGVNIPLDVFSSTGGITTTGTSGTFNPFSYSSYTPPPYINPTAGVSGVGYSSPTTSPSVSSIVSSNVISSLTPSTSSIDSSPSLSSVVPYYTPSSRSSSSRGSSSRASSSVSSSPSLSSVVPSYKPSSRKTSSKSSLASLYSSKKSSSATSRGYYPRGLQRWFLLSDARTKDA